MPFADLPLMDAAVSRDEEHLVQYAWLGELAITKSIELVICRASDAGGFGWMLPMGMLSNGAVVCWPMVRTLVPGTANIYYFWPQTDKSLINFRDLFHFLWKPDDWEAATIKWRSPLANFAGCHTRFPIHGVKTSTLIPFQTCEKASFMKVVADEAFFEHKESFMKPLHNLIPFLFPFPFPIPSDLG